MAVNRVSVIPEVKRAHDKRPIAGLISVLYEVV